VRKQVRETDDAYHSCVMAERGGAGEIQRERP
jgi:hypothetical protein